MDIIVFDDDIEFYKQLQIKLEKQLKFINNLQDLNVAEGHFLIIKSTKLNEVKNLNRFKIIVLSDKPNYNECLNAFKIGVFAYFNTQSHKKLFHYAFKSTQKIMPPSILSECISYYLSIVEFDGKDRLSDVLLTLQTFDNIQKNILFLMIEAKTDRQICSILGIELKKYYLYLKKIINNFGMQNRLEFVNFIVGHAV